MDPLSIKYIKKIEKKNREKQKKKQRKREKRERQGRALPTKKISFWVLKYIRFVLIIIHELF